MKTIARPTELLAYLREHPEGADRRQIASDLRMSETGFRESLRRLQMTLGESEDFNVISIPIPGRAGTCRYRIATAMDADAQAFYDKETKYVISRVQKIQAVLRSLVTATDGRTRGGKIVRILHRHITRALEDIADVH